MSADEDGGVAEAGEVGLDRPADARDKRHHAEVQERVQLGEDREPIVPDQRGERVVLRER